MKVLLDEMFSSALAERLRDAGHDAEAVQGNPELEGLGDAALFAWCRANDRAIVTYNVADFIVLAKEADTAGPGHAGIIGISSRAFPQHPGSQAALLEPLGTFIAAGPPWPSFIVWLN